MSRASARLAAIGLVVALAGCATTEDSQSTGDASYDRPTPQERANDLRRSGSVNNRTGMAVPTALCARGARVISAWFPEARTWASACSSASRL